LTIVLPNLQTGFRKAKRMDFSFTPLQLNSKPLVMEYHLVSWDSRTLGYPVAEINRLEVKEPLNADDQFQKFLDWCRLKEVQICACRIGHDKLIESSFLQKHDFKFIELNYCPVIDNLDDIQVANSTIVVKSAQAGDEEILAQMAGRIFKHGRFHQDLELGPELGNERYKNWLHNSFKNPDQSIYKCLDDNEIVGFFIVEYPKKNCAYWSLNGLAPGLGGRGMGTRVWQAMMRFHQDEGIKSISPSITSHNAAVFNLYVKLGFRFPLPNATFHWRP
jgi:ribosomal protein S18 acetylase RimI-like enzyme